MRSARWRARAAVWPLALALALALGAVPGAARAQAAAGSTGARPGAPARGSGAGTAASSHTGTVAGTVTDAETGLPLVAVNVLLEGTALGAATDAKGLFRFAAPPGTYTLLAQSIGYRPQRREHLTVRRGLTARADLRLVPGVDVELAPIEVHGESELIQPESSASRRVLRGQDVRSIPVDDMLDAIALNAGVVARAGELHFRGGRAGEVLYQIDGIPARDPLTASPFSISTVALAESEVLLGGFDAEYGNAQSGIVEIRTREGGDRFAGEVRYETDNFGAPERTFTHFDRFSLGFGGPLPAAGLTYFLSYEGTFDDTYLKTRERRGSRTWLDLISLGGRQENLIRTTAKLAYRVPGGRDKLTFEVVRNRERRDVYDHVWSRDGYVQVLPDIDAEGNPIERYGRWSAFQLDSTYVAYNAPSHTPDDDTAITIGKLSWSRQLGRRASVDVRLGYLETSSDVRVAGKQPEDYAVVYPGYWDGNFDEGFFYATHGDFPFLSERSSRVWTVRVDGAHSTEKHDVKGGLLVAQNRMDLLQLDFPNETNAAGTAGRFRSDLAIRQSEGSFYLQDRWKYEGMVLNAGLRYDFFSLGNQYDAAEADRRVRDQWSPRLGIAIPLSDRDAMSFHYGRYFQVPDRRFIFEERSSNVRVRGNLNLEPEVTVTYQAAIQHLLTRDAAVTATIFFKDIFGLLTTERREVPGYVELVDVWTNQDFASARGIELSLRKRTGAPFWGEVAYTLSRATGVASSVEERLQGQDVETARAAEERPLDWDQRHTLNVTGHFGYPGDWIATLVANYGSGLPYTPIHLGERTQRTADQINSERLPSTFRVDAELTKFLHFWRQHVQLSVRAFNVFDSHDIVELAPSISPHAYVDEDDYVIYYTETGQAGGAAIDVDESGGTLFVPLHDPRVFERGRVVRVSVQWSF